MEGSAINKGPAALDYGEFDFKFGVSIDLDNIAYVWE
jgi:hypothetical protein